MLILFSIKHLYAMPRRRNSIGSEQAEEEEEEEEAEAEEAEEAEEEEEGEGEGANQANIITPIECY